MNIKKWLITSYILVILSPIVTGSILFNWIRDYDRDTSLNNHIENIERFDKYEELLDNPQLYKNYNNKKELLHEEEKNYVEIKLFNSNGYNIYSSGVNDIFTTNKENLYKDLYHIKRGYKADILRKPVFEDEELIGVYQITLNRKDFIKATNFRIILAINLFIGHFIIVILIIIKMINRKIDNPLKLLILSMKTFANGENINIDYDSQDEIGDLIDQFNLMKEDIEEKNIRLQIEKTSKEYMISAISHDLKTPLTSIRAYAEIMKKDNKGNNTKNYEDIIISKCDYMKEMIEDLNIYSILSSNYKMEFVSVEGEEFFTMLLSGYEQMVKTRDLNYREDINIEGNYRVDVKSIIRLMDNLISNAIRYSKDGEEILIGVFSNKKNLPNYINDHIKKEIEKFKDNETVVLVQNTGASISKEDLEKIFEPFYKADNSRKISKKAGTGLGLNIASKIVEKHEGHIKMISDNNLTTVIFTMKREDKEYD